MLRVNGLSFSYNTTSVLEQISFELPKGEVLAVMGESGCGKSTLLRLIYGELPFDTGNITWDKHEIKGPPFQLLPGAPFMKFLAQDYDLMPYLTVEENIHKFLSVREPDASKKRGEELMEAMELTGYRGQKVQFLSGGQQQRVALARVLAQKPQLLLLDEPFSHIDAFRRNKLRQNLFQMLRQEGIACICATHDYHDVLPFAQKVLVLKDSKVHDHRDTKEVFEQPIGHYEASLFGLVNQIPIRVLKPYGTITNHVLVYPHELQVSPKSGMETEVLKSYFMGGYYRIQGAIEAGLTVHFNSEIPLMPGKKVFLNIPLEIINKRLV
jgi:iron(III) transport system ATP-binding protein